MFHHPDEDTVSLYTLSLLGCYNISIKQLLIKYICDLAQLNIFVDSFW